MFGDPRPREAALNLAAAWGLSLDELKAIFKPYSNYYPNEVLEHINRVQLKELEKDNFFSFDKNVGVYFLSNSTPF